MIFSLREFEDFPAEKTVQAGPGQIKPFADNVTRVEGVEAELAIQKSGQEYFCQCKVVAGVVVECARCLGKFFTELSGDADFIICSETAATEHAQAVENGEYVCYRGNDLCVDISGPVRQTMVLSLPLKPLCSQKCRGLCPCCGQNLNERLCSCEREQTDPRWDDLKGLLPRQTDK